MGMWPRVDVETVRDYAAESPWTRRVWVRIRMDVPLEKNRPEAIDALLNRRALNAVYQRLLEEPRVKQHLPKARSRKRFSKRETADLREVVRALMTLRAAFEQPLGGA